MPINPWCRAQQKLLADLDSYEQLVIDPAAAERFAAYGAPAEPHELPELEITELGAPGPCGPVPIRPYRPVGPTGRPSNWPGLLWVHGAGFRKGDLAMNEPTW